MPLPTRSVGLMSFCTAPLWVQSIAMTFGTLLPPWAFVECASVGTT
jgi:hypothetical protein